MNASALLARQVQAKSTLLHIMGLLDTPTEGEILFEDQDIRQMDDTTLSRLRGRAIGFVFQSFHLLSHLTVVENVALPLFYQGIPARERIARALASLEEVRMTHRRGHRPSELSGGECQRTAIARALVTSPRLILADEPTGNLDSVHGAEIMAIFQRLNESGRTIAVITHDQAIAATMPRRIRLADGKIVEESL